MQWYAQLSLAIVMVLKGKTNNFASWLGLKCSSFCSMNCGTSGRAASSSTGYDHRKTVLEGNCMLERRDWVASAHVASILK